MLHSLRILTSLLAILFLLAACAPAAPGTTDAPSEEERLRVVVSILPIANIVYNIGGDRIDLDAIMPPGADEVMGFDRVMPNFSIAQEATALGCQVDWSDTDMMPNPTDAPWADHAIGDLVRNTI